MPSKYMQMCSKSLYSMQPVLLYFIERATLMDTDWIKDVPEFLKWIHAIRGYLKHFLNHEADRGAFEAKYMLCLKC